MQLSPRMLSEMMMRAEAQAELIRATQDAVRDLRVTEESDDGLISVTADANGRLLDLKLDPRIYRDSDSGQLAKTILLTQRSAAEKAAKKAARLFEGLMPVEDDTDLTYGPALHELDQVASGKVLDTIWDGRNR